ncbi:hypothetical protein GIB67_029207, partial [Kingdonia uniflora]
MNYDFQGRILPSKLLAMAANQTATPSTTKLDNISGGFFSKAIKGMGSIPFLFSQYLPNQNL